MNFDKIPNYRTNPHPDEKRGLLRKDTFPPQEKFEIAQEYIDDQNLDNWANKDPEKTFVKIEDVADTTTPLENFENEDITQSWKMEKNSILENGEELVNEENIESTGEGLINGKKLENLDEEYTRKNIEIFGANKVPGYTRRWFAKKHQQADFGIRPIKPKDERSGVFKGRTLFAKNAKRPNNNTKPFKHGKDINPYDKTT